MLVSSLLATAGAPPPGGGLIGFLFPLILIGFAFYFIMLRPQLKQQKKHKAMLEALRRGDQVVTSSGFIGKVAKIDGEEIQLDLGEGVRVRLLRQAIADVRSKSEPVKGDKVD